MYNISKQSVIFILIASLILVTFTTTAMAETTSEFETVTAGSMTIDILLVRPLGIVATAVGTVVFVASLPFSLLGGNVGKAGKALVVEPFSFTFNRPLGDLD